MTTEKRRGLLLIFILYGTTYLRKATARQVVHSDAPSMTTEKTRGLLFIFILPEKSAGAAGSG
jgi:hypothetical protein